MIDPLPPDERSILGSIKFKSMIELGDKYSLRHRLSYKEFFEGEGIQHTSVDWNGAHGALRMDLRELHELTPADVVTNYGCTEHVDPQGMVWQNIVNWVKTDGYLVCATPIPGDWPWHGIHYPTGEWYVQFCDLNGFHIEELSMSKQRPKRNWCLRAKKQTDEPFRLPDVEMFKNNP